MTMAENVVKAMKAWERKEADFYPTPVDVTRSAIPIIEVMREYMGKPPENFTVWEPSCGDGRMSRVLEAQGYNVISSDIRPHSGYGGTTFDFLRDNVQDRWGWFPERGELDMIVMNPPFSLAIEFIEQALTYTRNVVVLLKSNYWHTQNRLQLFRDKRPSYWFPLTWRPAFLAAERGKSPMMDCAWAVWSQEFGPDDPCIMEPMKRLPYEGYADLGVLTALDILEGEMAELSSAMRDAAAR